MNSYDDIINLPHHVSKTRTPMSMSARAAQFAPFAALSGYEDEILEISRETEEMVGSSDELWNKLNEKLKILEIHLNDMPLIQVTYFVSDTKKKGGNYKIKEGKIRIIDKALQELIFDDKTKINFHDIVDIHGDIFRREEI